MYHEDDIKLAKELMEAHAKLSDVADRVFKASGALYTDLCKSEENFLKALHAARVRKNALGKLTTEEKQALRFQ